MRIVCVKLHSRPLQATSHKNWVAIKAIKAIKLVAAFCNKSKNPKLFFLLLAKTVILLSSLYSHYNSLVFITYREETFECEVVEKVSQELVFRRLLIPLS